MNKPPIGLMPKDIWELQRLKDVKEAIQRYLEDGRKIPVEWVNEFNELLSKPEKSCVERCGHDISGKCVVNGCKYKID